MHIVIIGNGITGITCARNIRKLSDHQITVISNESDHFFSRTALMYIYMGHMTYKDTKPYEDWFWEKNRIELKREHVTTVQHHDKTISFANGSKMHYDKLILATGSKSNKFGWPGQDLHGVQGLYHLQDLELMEQNTKQIKRAVIVGGGLIGIEMAEMLMSRNIPVTFLVREKNYWDNVLPEEEAQMISDHIREHHATLHFETELKEIIGDENGRVKAVITNKGETIECQFVGLTAGVHPNIDLAKAAGIDCNRGILVNEFLETNIHDIYAAGDCAEHKHPKHDRKPIDQVWYTGALQGKALAKIICGEQKEYDPGIWFNSAKFFDIEYQVYGDILNVLRDDEEALFWKHKDNHKAVRIVYRKNSFAVIGFNLMGVRYRHEVCERWIREQRDLKYVMENLRAANFDPEFFDRHENEIEKMYNLKFPQQQVKLKSKRKLISMIFNQ